MRAHRHPNLGRLLQPLLQEPGVEYDRWWIPWGSLGALFIGGATNQSKLGPEVEQLVTEGSHPQRLGAHGPR